MMKLNSVIHNGKELKLTNNLQFDLFSFDPYYYAIAVDDKDNKYMVQWNLINPPKILNEDRPAEENDCDWNKPSNVIKL
ncbi:hypothetical protein ACI3ER_12125 [Bacillus sp. Wb]